MTPKLLKAAEPLVVAILAVVFGSVALALGHNSVVILSVFGILGWIVGWKMGKVIGKAQG